MAEQTELAAACELLRSVVSRWYRQGYAGECLDAAAAALDGLDALEAAGGESTGDPTVLKDLRDRLQAAVDRHRELGHGGSLTAAGAQLVMAIDNLRLGQ
ncbi:MULTISPECIES: hypothetical protein [Mycolicibacter]|uniref:Uncharacterized protein n=1 Tax=Mycolicibacter longobardus TaxID=1108812 RepID=A0A1X1YAE8_9MYCO|nr:MULTISPECIES: hypothetical protein [Mycolicibacter]ORW08068.1 hypothetical protein AWC16_20250 [Mycolicibacter longobardus]RAV04286.1 hypothetical protein DQP56_00260 [Mycolicibacter senuensis]